MNSVAEVRPYLFLGSAAGRTSKYLTDNGITFVVNAAGDHPMTDKCCVKQHKIDASDNPKYNLKQHFDKVADLISTEKEKDGKIYVHCIGGISRGPSLVLAYLMKHEKISLREAHDLVKAKRTFVRPNRGFWEQLIEYEAQVLGSNTVEMRQCGKTTYASVYQKDYENMVT